MDTKNGVEYAIVLSTIMRKLKLEDVVILTILYDGKTDQYSGISSEDLLQDERLIAENIGRTSLNILMNKLEFIGAVGHYNKAKKKMYFIEETGWAMIAQLQDE